jgi:hypothetical protein
MAKMIKFDLSLNGNKVKNLEELLDNFTFEIITIAHNGRLLRWLLSRDENELADKVKATEELTEDLELFKALASIFEIEYDEESLQEMYAEFLSMDNLNKSTQIQDDNNNKNILSEAMLKAAMFVTLKEKNTDTSKNLLLKKIANCEREVTKFWDMKRNYVNKKDLRCIGALVNTADAMINQAKNGSYQEVLSTRKNFDKLRTHCADRGNELNDIVSQIQITAKELSELNSTENEEMTNGTVAIDELLAFILDNTFNKDDNRRHCQSIGWLVEQLEAFYEDQDDVFEINDALSELLEKCEQ